MNSHHSHHGHGFFNHGSHYHAPLGSFVGPPVVSGLDDDYVPSRDGFRTFPDTTCFEPFGDPHQNMPPNPWEQLWFDWDEDSSSDDEDGFWGPTAIPGARMTPGSFTPTGQAGSRAYTECPFGIDHTPTHRSSHRSSRPHGSASTRHGGSHQSGPSGSHHGSGHAFQGSHGPHRPSEHRSVPGSRYGLASSHHGSRHDSNFGGHSSGHGHRSSHGGSHYSSRHGGAGSHHRPSHHSSHHGGGGSRHGTSRLSARTTEQSW